MAEATGVPCNAAPVIAPALRPAHGRCVHPRAALTDGRGRGEAMFRNPKKATRTLPPALCAPMRSLGLRPTLPAVPPGGEATKARSPRSTRGLERIRQGTLSVVQVSFRATCPSMLAVEGSPKLAETNPSLAHHWPKATLKWSSKPNLGRTWVARKFNLIEPTPNWPNLP